MATTTEPISNPVLDASRESMATMEREAAEIFANRGKQQAALVTGTKVAEPATNGQTESTPAKVSETTTAALDPGKVASKVAGLPDPAKEPDFSDVPEELPQHPQAPQWKRLHAKATHFKNQSTTLGKELETLKSKIAEFESKTAVSPELTTQLTQLAKERDDLQARLEAIAVERSPRFEAAYKPRVEAALAQAKQAVGPDRAARVEALFAMPESSYRDEQLEALMSEINSPIRSAKLTQAIADLDRVTAEKSQLSSKSSELFKSWQAQEAASREQQQSERLRQANAVFDAELPQWEAAKFSPEEIKTAREIYQGKDMTLADAARTAFWAVAGPRSMQTAKDALARVAELEGQLAKLKSVQPGTSSDNASVNTAPPDDDPSTTSYMDRIAKLVVENGLLRR